MLTIPIRLPQLPTILPGFLLCMALQAAPANPHRPAMPFAFVENRGQADPHFRYLGLGPDFRAWFGDQGVLLQRGASVVRITFADPARSHGLPVIPPITATDPLGAKANFLRGNDRKQWQTDLALFKAIHYSGIWPGVEITYKAEKSTLEAEYLVAPGASPDEIRLSFDGQAEIEPDGTLRIRRQAGDFIEDKPLIYQNITGARVQVDGRYRNFPDGSVGFEVGDYDRHSPLIIDPAILISGFFGGNGEENITAITFDVQNNILVGGWTTSTNLAAGGGAQQRYGGSVDAFVAAFLPDGGPLIYCTYLGGSGADEALGIATDSSRNVYITGWNVITELPSEKRCPDKTPRDPRCFRNQAQRGR